jgi:FkbM family methyltransferase
VNRLLKRQIGTGLLILCDRFPGLKRFVRRWGLRTSKEWFGDRVVRVQVPGGRSFKLASVSRNYLSFELFWRGTEYYEPITTLVLQELVCPGATFIDVGANIGFHSLVLSVSQPQFKIIAFEPNPKNHELLKANAAANGFSHIACEPLALSDTDGGAVLHLSASDMSASLCADFDPHPTDSVPVKTITLDSYLGAANFQGRLVIKVDVEGHEPAFFRGARRTLHSLQPDIVAEVAVDYDDDTKALLRDAGYRFYPITDRGMIESDSIAPVVRESFVFLNCLFTCRPVEEVEALFARIREQVRRIDLRQTSKRLDPASLERFKSRQFRGHVPEPAVTANQSA